MITVDQSPVNGVRVLLISFVITYVLNIASSYWPSGSVRDAITKTTAPPGIRSQSKPLFSRGYLIVTSAFWWIGTFLIFFTDNQNSTPFWVFAGLYGGYLVLDKFWYHFYFYRRESSSSTIGMILLGGAFLLNIGMLVDFLVGQLIFRNTLCTGAPVSPFVCGNYGIGLAGAIVFFIHIVMYFVLVRRVVDDWSVEGKVRRR